MCEHKDKKVYSRGMCYSCWYSRWKIEHPEAYEAKKARDRKALARNDDRRRRKLDAQQKWREANREHVNAYNARPDQREAARLRAARWRGTHPEIATRPRRTSVAAPSPKYTVEGATFADRMAEYRRIYEAAQRK